MGLKTIHPITVEGAHEQRIRQLEKQVRRLANQSAIISIYTDAEVADLDPNDGSVWVGSDDNSFNYVLNGVTYQLFGA